MVALGPLHQEPSVSVPTSDDHIHDSSSSSPKTNLEQVSFSICPTQSSNTNHPTTTNDKTNITKPVAKSVRFAQKACMYELPSLSQEDKSALFYNSEDKRSMKLAIKQMVVRIRRGGPLEGNNDDDDADERIGLESHVYPQIKQRNRKRLYRLVSNHQKWEVQNPSFFDDVFLAKNCCAISYNATEQALARARSLHSSLSKEANSPTSNQNCTGKARTEPAATDTEQEKENVLELEIPTTKQQPSTSTGKTIFTSNKGKRILNNTMTPILSSPTTKPLPIIVAPMQTMMAR